MMLGEIKTSCNLFENSPIESETQPYLQKISIFCQFHPSSEWNFSKFKK